MDARERMSRLREASSACLGCGLAATRKRAVFGEGPERPGCLLVGEAPGATEDETGRRYPEVFRINFSRCIFCGYCEEACPTYAIQLTPDFEMSDYARENLVYEKEHLLISGPGKYHDHDFYKVAGVAIGGKGKGQAENEEAPVDLHALTP